MKGRAVGGLSVEIKAKQKTTTKLMNYNTINYKTKKSYFN